MKRLSSTRIPITKPDTSASSARVQRSALYRWKAGQEPEAFDEALSVPGFMPKGTRSPGPALAACMNW